MTHYDEGAEDPEAIGHRPRYKMSLGVSSTPLVGRACENCRQLRRALEQERAEVQRLRFQLQEAGQDW